LCFYLFISTRLDIKEITVIGPTPPGTGEIALTLSLTSLKLTSPSIFLLLKVFIPTSTIVAFSLTFSFPIRLWLPAATIRISHSSVPFIPVLRSNLLTLKPWDSIASAKGLPTRFDWPITPIILFLKDIS